MHIYSRKEKGFDVIYIEGTLSREWDTNQKVRAFLLKFVDDPKVSKILINLKGVDFLTSSGIGLLVDIYQRMEERNARFILCELGDPVLKILKATLLDQIFTIYTTEKEALSRM